MEILLAGTSSRHDNIGLSPVEMACNSTNLHWRDTSIALCERRLHRTEWPSFYDKNQDDTICTSSHFPKVGDPSQPKLLSDTIGPIFWLIHWNVWTVLAAPTKKNNNNMCFLSPILRLNHFATVLGHSQVFKIVASVFTLCYWTA